MTEIRDINTIISIVNKAIEKGGNSLASLQKCFAVLRRLKQTRPGETLSVYNDFEPFSFGFCFSGGLHGAVIFHTRTTGHSSIELTPLDYDHWTLHT